MQHFLEREIACSAYPEDETDTGQLVREMRAKYGVTDSETTIAVSTEEYRK